MSYNKGDKIKVTGDSILTGMMGLGQVVTGTIFTVVNGRIIGFKCDQTGSIECIDDGKVEVLK